MRRALELARRGQGWVEPNPMVGCVLVKHGRIIGEGFHRRFGGAHAEVEALGSAGESPRGATAYVTLEPCNHFGKTPPCTDALLRAGIRDVVAAMPDPGPMVAGRGLRRLRAEGVTVRVGCLGEEARALNAPYRVRCAHGRPYVLLKWAQSLDGRLSVPAGLPRTISGPAAHRWVHALRARVDAIAVGIETVRADDPLLTARGVRVRRVATRIVFDSRLRLDPKCRLVQTAGETPTLVLTTVGGLKQQPGRAGRLRRAGVEIEACRARGGRVDLTAAFRLLGRRGMTNVLIEGGATLLRGILAERWFDEGFVFVSPRVLGGTPSSPFDLGGLNPVDVTWARIGDDALFHLLPRP